jgi:hypothetical protein
VFRHRFSCVALAFLMIALTVGCQPAEPAAESETAAIHSPYHEEQLREIKALSATEVSAYLEGRGMGFALPAELNSYPGPRHAIDAADQLQLSEQQRERVAQIFEQMNGEARRLGARLVEKERELDRLFSGRTASEPAVAQVTNEIGTLLGEIRFVHLRAHLETTRILSRAQIDHYVALRGYGEEHHHSGRH